MTHWIKDLKSGDKFLDANQQYVGTVIQNDGIRLLWVWTNIQYGNSLRESNLSHEQLIDTHWIRFTPLMEALL